MTSQAVKQQAERMRNNREELVERMMRLITEDGILDIFEGLRIARLLNPSETLHTVYEPCFCFVVQGSKRVVLNGEDYRYDPGHYLITTVGLPVSVRVEEASSETPYLGTIDRPNQRSSRNGTKTATTSSLHDREKMISEQKREH